MTCSGSHSYSVGWNWSRSGLGLRVENGTCLHLSTVYGAEKLIFYFGVKTLTHCQGMIRAYPMAVG